MFLLFLFPTPVFKEQKTRKKDVSLSPNKFQLSLLLMSEPLGLQHVIFIPLRTADWLFLRVLDEVFVADFNTFRKFLESSLSIMHLLPPSPPNLMCDSSHFQ